MKICLVGGIFDRPEAIRAKHVLTPETVLLDGFRKSGVDVSAVGHAGFQPSDEYDIVHVHHQGRAALKMATAKCRALFVFTGHNGEIVSGYESSRLRRSAFQYVVDKADAVVALSEAEGRYFAQADAAHKVKVIPNGIPADVFPLAAKQADKPTFDLLYVGQLIGWKGVDYLLKAVAELRRRWNLRLRLVYHNARLETELKDLATKLAITDVLDWVGILGPAELARAYGAADVLVLPSFADCLPSVVTEALLCGTPVVAGGVCGVPDQVDAYGAAVRPGDLPELVGAIEKVLQDRPRYQALAEDMRAYAERKFNPQAMVRAHLGLYEDLLKRRSDNRRRGWWLDPLVRLAVRAYWARGKGNRVTVAAP